MIRFGTTVREAHFLASGLVPVSIAVWGETDSGSRPTSGCAVKTGLGRMAARVVVVPVLLCNTQALRVGIAGCRARSCSLYACHHERRLLRWDTIISVFQRSARVEGRYVF